MPALPNVPGAVKIVVQQTLANVNVYNILHAYGSVPGGYTSSELGALATAFRAAWVTNVIPLQASELTLGSVVVQDLSTNTGLEAAATGTTAGSAGGFTAAANVAVCWSWKIANRYRGGHPRTYIAGPSVGAVLNANTWTTGTVTAHQAAAEAIQSAIQSTAISGNFWAAGTISYYSNKLPRVTPEFRQFTGVSIDNRIDSQRRRLGRDR